MDTETGNSEMRHKRRHVLETQRAREKTHRRIQSTHFLSKGAWLPGQSGESLLPLVSSLALFSRGARRPALSAVTPLSRESDGSVVARPAGESSQALLSGWSRFSRQSGQARPSWWSVDQQPFLRTGVANDRLALKNRENLPLKSRAINRIHAVWS